MTEILQEYLPSNPIGVLSGPNHAEDICLGLPSAASLIGFEDPKYATGCSIFASKTFRVYSATDIIGMQLGNHQERLCHRGRTVRGAEPGR